MKRVTKAMKAALIAAGLMTTFAATSANYPNRPVKFVVPWPPGDLEDILTRVIAEEMSKETGKPASVVNKPGGGGVVGATDVSRSRPDGLVIGSFVADILTTQVLFGTAPFDQNSFEPVGIFLDYPFAIAVKSDAPYNNLEELAAYSKSNKVTLGHFGYQALPTAITFKAADQIGIKFSSDAPFDVLDCSTLANGDADVINTTTQLILACLNSGDVKLLTSISRDRLSITPDVATLAEQTGITQTTWNGLFVKKGTPQNIKDKIAGIAEKALQAERVKEISMNTGAGVYWLGGKEAEALLAKDFEQAKSLLNFMNQ